MKKVIRNMKAYNKMMESIKEEVATGIRYYKITECTNNTLYGGVECYTQTASGAYINRNGEVFSTEFSNSVGTTFSEGIYNEEQIQSISKDIALRAIKFGLKEAFTAPEFVGNEQDCPENDDGMWWNNNRLVPSCTVVEVNDRRWIIYYQD